MYKPIFLSLLYFFFFQSIFLISEPVSAQNLCFYNTHTHETFKGMYKNGAGALDPIVLTQIDHIFRDHRTNQTHKIDPSLLDLLSDLAHVLNPKDPGVVCFHIISGYRSPQTNGMLRQKSKNVSKNSLHLEGKAVDIRVPGVSLSHVCQAAKSLKRGGVGCYKNSNFVHVDRGRVRAWGD